MADVLVLGRLHEAAMARLEAEPGLKVTLIEAPEAALPAAELARAEGLLIRYGRMSEAEAAAAPHLRIVSRHGVGTDNLPVTALAARGVPVTVVGPVNAVSVAEQVMAMILALLRRVGPYDRAVRAGDWAIRDSLCVHELAGRRLLLIGFGRIGREVAARARAFAVDVQAHDPFLPEAEITAAGATPVPDWRAALPEADIISLHLPLSPGTSGLIGAAELAAMKPGAILVNAARGGLVEEAALATALQAGRPGAAALDCLAEEPPAADHPLLALENVLFSPHSAALAEETARRMGEVAVQNLLDGLAGRADPALVVDRHALERAHER